MRRPVISEPATTVHVFDPSTFVLRATEARTDADEPFWVYSAERSIVDAMRMARWVGRDVALHALQRYLRCSGAKPRWSPDRPAARSVGQNPPSVGDIAQLTTRDVEPSARAAFGELQRTARKSGSNMQSLLMVYAVESFLRRLAISEYAQHLVLEGGMLMAAHSIRRMTRDADLSTHGVRNDETTVAELVNTINAIEPEPPDGITFDTASLRTEGMREDAEYRGGCRRTHIWLGPAFRSRWTSRSATRTRRPSLTSSRCSIVRRSPCAPTR